MFENEKLENIKYILFNQKEELKKLKESKKALLSQYADLKEKIQIENIAINIIEMLKNYKLEYKKDIILDIINSALKDIFQDNIEINIEQEVKKTGIKYNIVFYQNGVQIAKNEELLESNGGGVLSVISVLFKILIGFFYSGNKFFIFDESFAQVSPEYRERLSKFLRKFAQHYDFTIILVAQTSDLSEHAHISYKVNYEYENINENIKSKNEKLKIKKLLIQEKNINIDQELKYKYVFDIKNFQSIKHQTFEFEGFCTIEGPNNTGKSAILRAINVLIFNEFKERYLRIGSKISEIKLEYYENEKLIDKIILKYKSKKIIYEIDGEEYLGKNLAKEIIQSKMEKLGFKFIDIKKLYKNIKPELRAQMEKISFSSQFDNLFMIGKKSNDNEKIFNFLFNTEQLTLIIVELKEKIKEKTDEIKIIDKQIKLIDTEIQKLEKKLQFNQLKYKYLLLKECKKSKKELKKMLSKKALLNKEKDKIEKNIENLKQRYFKYKLIKSYQIHLLKNKEINFNLKKLTEAFLELSKKALKIDNIKNAYQKYKKILEFKYKLESLNDSEIIIRLQIQKLKTSKKYLDNKINEKIQKLKSLNEKLLKYKKLIINLNDNKIKIEKIQSAIDQYRNYLEKLNNQFNDILKENNIQICPYCKGLGYHKIK